MDNSKLWSISAEAAVIGSILVDSPCMSKVLPILPTEQVFFQTEHQAIYAALVCLYMEQIPIDAIALRDMLKKINTLEAAGGVEYIAKIMDSVPHSANAVYYAKIVQERARYRQLISIVGEIKNVPDEPTAVYEQIQKVQELALSIDAGKPERDCFEADYAKEVVERIHDQQQLIKTGFPNIDRILGGFSSGDFAIIAGRPSMGKSSLALDLTLRMMKAGKSIQFFDLEMTPDAFYERALFNLAQVDSADVKCDEPNAVEVDKLHQEAYKLAKLKLAVYKDVNTPEKLIAHIRTRKKTHGVDVVFVDYLQLMGTSRKAESRLQEISTISRKLKLAAIQEGVPIIALSQLNRKVEERNDHRPRMSDLRETGALEQDADVVMLLYREGYYRQAENPTARDDGVCEVIVAKNRRGPIGIAKLMFVRQFTRFENYKEVEGY